MQEDEPKYEALVKENLDLKLELAEVKAQLAELRRLIYDSTSESRSHGSNHTPAKKAQEEVAPPVANQSKTPYL